MRSGQAAGPGGICGLGWAFVDEDPQNMIASAARTLIVGLAAAEAVIGIPDQQGTGMITGGSTESRPPWNTAAAYVITDAHVAVRRIEARVRHQVTGTTATRGGSDTNTRLAIEALTGLAGGLGQEEAAGIARELEKLAEPAMALPGVGQPPYWLPIALPGGHRPPPCPYCVTPSLRVNELLGIIRCFKPACPVPYLTVGGFRPWAQVNRDEGGRVLWTWPDGTRQP